MFVCMFVCLFACLYYVCMDVCMCVSIFCVCRIACSVCACVVYVSIPSLNSQYRAYQVVGSSVDYLADAVFCTLYSNQNGPRPTKMVPTRVAHSRWSPHGEGGELAICVCTDQCNARIDMCMWLRWRVYVLASVRVCALCVCQFVCVCVCENRRDHCCMSFQWW